MTMISIIWPVTVFGIAAMVTIAALVAWRGWLDLKRLQIAAERPARDADSHPGVRIEMASIRERLRKLEEIATGVDL